jgi:transposase-like protein
LSGFLAPKSLPEFQRVFPDEGACIAHLFDVRFPGGFACPTCGDTREPYRIAGRPAIVRCRAGQHETSLTASTVMHRTKVPIATWFWGAWLATVHTPGISALQFQKLLGMRRYETAFQMLHKLRAAMARPERSGIGGKWTVEVDETFVGGATQGEGKGRHHKTLVAGAVEIRPRKDAPGPDPNLPTGQAQPKHRGGHGRSVMAGRVRLQVVSSRHGSELEPFVAAAVLPGSHVKTDGWSGYGDLERLGYVHEPLAINGDQSKTDAHLPMIHIVFGNLDAWLLGTHHGVSPQHLQAYLNEFAFRFNRRFWPMAAFNAVLGIAARVPAPTYAALYDGSWVHPTLDPALPLDEPDCGATG